MLISFVFASQLFMSVSKPLTRVSTSSWCSRKFGSMFGLSLGFFERRVTDPRLFGRHSVGPILKPKDAFIGAKYFSNNCKDAQSLGSLPTYT